MFSAKDIEYLLLNNDNFNVNSLDGFILNQKVSKCWRKVNGGYSLLPVSYTEHWNLEERRAMALKILDAVKSGAVAFAATFNGEIVGFALLDGKLFGSKKQYADLCEFYVCERFRRHGIGEILFEKVCFAAKKLNAEKLYISAHSAEESIAAYKKYGCVSAQEPDEKHVEKEPCDLQLEFDLSVKMAKSDDIGQAYDFISDDWQKFRNSTKINKCIVDFAEYIKPNGKILDVGCGTGYPVAQFLAEHGFCVTGIDVSEKMIKKAKKLRLANAEFIKKDILDFSSDELYDGVIAFDSIWHVAKDKQPLLYEKISSLMNCGAHLLFTHGKTDGETVGKMFDREFYYSALDIEKLKLILAEAGLKIVSLTENYREETTGERDLLVIARKEN